jgi:hypothetical protein
LILILDEAGLKEAGPTFYNDPITKQFKTIKVRTLLKSLLNERGMDYYIDDAQLILTKDLKAAKMMVVKVHDLGDLLDSKNIDGSKRELQNAVKLLDPKILFPGDPVPAPVPAPAKEQKKKGLLSDAEPAPGAVPEPPGAQIIRGCFITSY